MLEQIETVTPHRLLYMCIMVIPILTDVEILGGRKLAQGIEDFFGGINYLKFKTL